MQLNDLDEVTYFISSTANAKIWFLWVQKKEGNFNNNWLWIESTLEFRKQVSYIIAFYPYRGAGRQADRREAMEAGGKLDIIEHICRMCPLPWLPQKADPVANACLLLL